VESETPQTFDLGAVDPVVAAGWVLGTKNTDATGVHRQALFAVVPSALSAGDITAAFANMYRIKGEPEEGPA
ncbi:hypothetical protein RZS08_13300, partial [Arthrospira platensis SPKY1]|nr:hypothetical protein [Arthrospira platensis SPKY1]